MLQRLKKMYPSLCLLEDVDQDCRAEYDWFILTDQQRVGFRRGELTEKEQALLEVFLTPYEQQFPSSTIEEQRWEVIVKEEKNSSLEGTYRFVFFSFDQRQLTPTQFKLAITAVFGEDIPVLWINAECGMLVERLYEHEEPMQYEEMIHILMHDLAAKLKLYVSQSVDQSTNIGQVYRLSYQVATHVFQQAEGYVFTYTTVLPHLLGLRLLEDVAAFKGMLLGEYLDDADMMQLIQSFVNCDLNVTETAKQLHLHRNSLQYRLDKFEKETQLNIRKFQHAMTAYLLYLRKSS